MKPKSFISLIVLLLIFLLLIIGFVMLLAGRNGKAGEVKDCSNGTMLAAGGSGKAGEMKDHSNGTICIHYIEGHQLPCEYVDNAREDLASKIGGEPRNDGSWMRG